jgi:hypothetical protein
MRKDEYIFEVGDVVYQRGMESPFYVLLMSHFHPLRFIRSWPGRRLSATVNLRSFREDGTAS